MRSIIKSAGTSTERATQSLVESAPPFMFLVSRDTSIRRGSRPGRDARCDALA
jgi:hypothetical protein